MISIGSWLFDHSPLIILFIRFLPSHKCGFEKTVRQYNSGSIFGYSLLIYSKNFISSFVNVISLGNIISNI